MRRPVILGMAFTLAAAGIGTATAQSSWSPDSRALGQLAAEARLPGFTIRPPKGYRLSRRVAVANSRSTTWTSKSRRDGTSASVTVQIVQRTPQGMKHPTAETALNRLLAAERQSGGSFTRSKPENGTINGIPFVRARWSRAGARGARTTHGVAYVAARGPQLIWIMGRDVSPHQASLSVAEASAQTFRLR